MKVFVTAKIRSKNPGIEKMDDSHYTVAVRQAPQGGQANVAIIEILAEYFGVGISKISIISGYTGKHKVFEVNN